MTPREALERCEDYFKEPCIEVTGKEDKEAFDKLRGFEDKGSYRGKLTDSMSVISVEYEPGWYDDIAVFLYKDYNVFDGRFRADLNISYILPKSLYLQIFDPLNYLLKEF